MTIKGRGAGKMPWRAACGSRAVGCRPLGYGTVEIKLLIADKV